MVRELGSLRAKDDSKCRELFLSCSVPLVPRAPPGSAQLHAVGQQRERLGREPQLGGLRLDTFGPREGALLQPLGQTHRPVPSQQRIFKRERRRLVKTNNAPGRGSSPSFSVTKGVQAVEAFAQVARLQRHEPLQAARKTQHEGRALPAPPTTLRPAGFGQRG